MATEKDKILAEKEADRLIAKFDSIRLALVDSIMVCFEHQDKISKLAKEYREKNKETIAIKKKEWCDKRKSEKKEYDRLYYLKKKLEKEQQKLSSK